MDLSPQNQQEKKNDINLQAFNLQNDTQQQEGSSNKLNSEQKVQDSSLIQQTQQEPVNFPESKNGQHQQEQQNQDLIKQTAGVVCQEILEKVVDTVQDKNQNLENNLNETQQNTSNQVQQDVQGNVQEPQVDQKNEQVNQDINTNQNQQDHSEKKNDEQIDQNQEDKNLVQNSQEEQNNELPQQDTNQEDQQNQDKSSQVDQNQSQNNSKNLMQELENQNVQQVNEVQDKPEVVNQETPLEKEVKQVDSQEQQMEIEEEDKNQKQESQPEPQVDQTQQTVQKNLEQNIVQEQTQNQKQDEVKIESDEDDNNVVVLNPQVYLFKKSELVNLLQQKQDVLSQQVNQEQNFKGQVSKLVQGKEHMLLLTKTGDVYCQGSNEFGQCGTESNTQTFQKVTLNENVDLVDAGEYFSFAANSKTGNCYIWGKLSSKDISLVQYNLPNQLVNKKLKKDLISDIKCGNNHVLILSKNKIYVYGDKSYGALGNVFRKQVNRCDFQNLTTVNLKGVQRIFAFGNQSFAVTKRTKKTKNREMIYCFGSNNYQQLGFESELKNDNVEKLPFQWTQIFGDQIADITGTDQCTMVLYKNGLVYASGQNDKGQLGQLDKESEPFGTFEKVKDIPFKVSKIKCFKDFNFVVNKNNTKNFVWGQVMQSQQQNNLKQQNMFQTLVSDMSSNNNSLVVLAENESDGRSLKKKREYTGPELTTKSKVRIQQQLN